jgi:hypothetical protein
MDGINNGMGNCLGKGKTVGVKGVGVRFGSAPGKNDSVRTASRWGGGGGDGQGPDVHMRCGD